MAALDSHILKLNPDHQFESPHPHAHILTQIKELGTACELCSPAPSAHRQQFNPDFEIGSLSQPARIQELDFYSPASIPHFEQFHSTSDLRLSTLFAHNPIDPGFEFGSPSPTDHDQQLNPGPGFRPPASFGQFQQLQPSHEFDFIAPPAHVTNFDSAFELGSPTLLEYAQQYKQRLNSEPPQSFQDFPYAIGTEKLPSTPQVQVLDPRLQAAPLPDFQDEEYDPAVETVFPEIDFHHHNYIHHPGSSFQIAATQAAHYAYHHPQTDMSASFPQDQAIHACGSSSPAAFNQQPDKDNNGLHGDREFDNCFISY